jgi:hypothetical protein
MKRALATVVVSIVTLCGICLNAQQREDVRIPALVVHTGSDPVGVSVASNLRDELNRSRHYRLVDRNQALFEIRIVTVDPSVSDDGISTAIAVTYLAVNVLPVEDKNPQTWLPIYLSDAIHIAGRNQATAVAQLMVSELDQQIEHYMDHMR